MQESITDVSNSDHLTRTFTGINLRVGMCFLQMVSRSGKSFRFMSVAARVGELADCTISSIRSLNRVVSFSL